MIINSNLTDIINIKIINNNNHQIKNKWDLIVLDTKEINNRIKNFRYHNNLNINKIKKILQLLLYKYSLQIELNNFYVRINKICNRKADIKINISNTIQD